MGAENTKTGRSIESFLEEYQEARVQFDNRLGEVRVYKSKADSKKRVFIKEKWFEDREKFEEFKEKVEKREFLKSLNIVPLLMVIGKLFSIS